MVDGIRVMWRGLSEVRHQGYTYIWANVAFVVLCLPLITAPAAISALFRVGHVAQTESHEADLSIFWETFRSNLWRALLWGTLHGLFAIVNFSNLIAYSGQTGVLIGVLRLCWMAATFVWVGVLLYTWPIYYEMENASLVKATGNALIMVLQNPIFTITILFGVLILSALSSVFILAWVLLTWGCLAAIVNVAVQNRISLFRQAQMK